MDMVHKYLASCGENLTLECKVEASGPLDIKRFYWMEKKDICDWNEPTNETDLECRSAIGAMNVYNFSLTIFDVQPKHKGTYHCKLRSKEGVENGKTVLRVQKCVGDSDNGMTTSGATCTFKDVFPESTVAWTRGSENLTDQATTTVTENAEGFFTLVSTIKVATSTSDLKCSLMMPVENEANVTMVQAVKSLKVNGGYMLIAHWAGVMLAMVLGMLMF